MAQISRWSHALQGWPWTWSLVSSDVTSGKDKSCQAFMQISDTIIACYRVYPEKNQPLRPFEKENLLLFNELQKFFFPVLTSRPARPRTLLDFINRPILKGVAPAGNLKRVFTGKSGQNRKTIFWESYLCVGNYSKLQKPYRSHYWAPFTNEPQNGLSTTHSGKLVY